MGAKDIILRPVDRKTADMVVKRHHYSGSVVRNSQFHVGVFYKGRLEGAMQFGPSLDKGKLQGLVADTGWNGFIELNRMAFGPGLPRNSESRALSVAFRIMRTHLPHIEWCVSFADATMCGDGTIYRAAGFALTGIKKNRQVWVGPDGDRIIHATVTTHASVLRTGASSIKEWKDKGYRPMEGYQLRYVYFLNPAARARLTVPVLRYDEIDRVGAGMYKGVPKRRAAQDLPPAARSRAQEALTDDAPPFHGGEGGSRPTPALLDVEDAGRDEQ